MKKYLNLISGLFLFVMIFSEAAFADREFYVAEDGSPTLSFDWKMIGNKREKLDANEKAKFKNELEEKLARKISLLQDELKNEIVLSALSTANSNNAELTYSEIVERNEEWMKPEMTELELTKFTDINCTNELKAFQKRDDSFAEIFVADKQGLNVCQTGKTTDYYQADEKWWIRAIEASDGKAFHGPLEYDQSASTFAFSIYLPIVDAKTNAIIGVGKGVIRQNF